MPVGSGGSEHSSNRSVRFCKKSGIAENSVRSFAFLGRSSEIFVSHTQEEVDAAIGSILEMPDRDGEDNGSEC